VFNPCVFIPVYNHEHAVGAVVDAVLAFDVPCILVDDGSSPECAGVLDRLAASAPDRITLLRHAINRGKGRAQMTGIAYAAQAGFTHALQVDADGQHCLDDIPRFFKEAEAHPGALIVGCPVYDESVPAVRFYSRYLTHVWVWINTLSFDIKDSMCGFRVYPVAPALELCKRVRMGERMTFDTEILVRLFWKGVEVINVPTCVGYPSDGVSHFKVVRDNAQISWMHTILFFGMLVRLPRLLVGKWRRA
jgi:glycosyltransferase involved in cell wall biosynthesis